MIKIFPFAFFLLSMFLSFGQTSHHVAVSNFQFSPAELTINVNDTVIWTNSDGSHNVNGSVEDFPSNPAGFWNEVGSDWVYEFVFTEPGTYVYICDPHPNAMIGVITVLDESTGMESVSSPEELQLYPNPTNGSVNLVIPGGDKNSSYHLRIRDLTGRMVAGFPTVITSRTELDLSSFSNGIYMAEVSENGKLIATRRLVIAH